MNGFGLEKLNKQAITDLGDDYRVEMYRCNYLLYKLGNIIYQTNDGLKMMTYIMLLSDRNKKEERRTTWYCAKTL